LDIKKQQKALNEPRVRIVVSPSGIERVEVWGADERDREAAMKLYFRLSDRYPGTKSGLPRLKSGKVEGRIGMKCLPYF